MVVLDSFVLLVSVVYVMLIIGTIVGMHFKMTSGTSHINFPWGWVFGVFAMLLMTCVVISGISYYINMAPAFGIYVGGNFLAIVILYWCNILLLFAYICMMYKHGYPWVAVGELFLCAATACGVLVLYFWTPSYTFAA